MTIRILVASLFVLVALSACSMVGGGSPVSINDIPAYPGATELKSGDSALADTLAKNSQQITAMSQSAGASGQTDQKGYALSQDATWDAVRKFYDDKLTSAGWSAPSGMVGSILSQVNTQNDAFQTVVYQRGNQTLAVIRVMMDPSSKQAMLIFSLSTR